MYQNKIQAIIDYNEDDCRATKLIKDWLQHGERCARIKPENAC
jgi:predicted RecB family nuclease